MLGVFLFLISPPAIADDILCERVPTAVVIEKIPPKAKSDNPCASASAKIQASAYECGNPNDVHVKTEEYLRADIHDAERKCEEFCKEIAPSCKAVLTKPTECALSIPSSKAIAVGREVVKCPKHCKGQAFMYCSLYHANFFSYDKELFKDLSPNCHCEKRETPQE